MGNHTSIAAVCSLLVVTVARAATLTVGVGAEYDYRTVQAAVDAAKNGDTVVVAPGTHTGAVRFLGKQIVLTSTDPNKPGATTLEVDPRREAVVTFSGSEGPDCVLRGFRIAEGNGTDAGGIAGNAAKATIADCIIEYNWSKGAGGGISNCDGLIQNCVISNNLARTFGGGLYDCDGTIRNCTISDNSCGHDEITGLGGGLYGCDGTIENCEIRGNEAIGDGGGLNNCDGTIRNCQIGENSAGDEGSTSNGGGLYGCDGKVSDCDIVGNTAAGGGGGLSDCKALVTGCTIQDNEAIGWHGGAAARCDSITQCTISSNWVHGYGGGLFSCKSVTGCTIRANTTKIYPGGGLSQCDFVANCIITDNQSGAGGGGLDQCKRVMNCVVAGNRAAEDGGGLHECREVLNCTVVGNLATGKGGGVYYGGYLGTVGNCILWDNSAPTAGQAYVARPAKPPTAQELWSLSLAYSDIQGARYAAVAEPNCQLLWDSSNMDEDPRFVKSGRWLGQMTWQAGDYRLLPSSPCVDAGDPNADYSGQTDIGGEPRVAGSRVDIGADECTTAAALFGDLRISGPSEVSAQSSAQFRATAYYTDGSSIDVTQFAAWSLEPAGFAAIDGSGLLTLQKVSQPIEAAVQAEYTDQRVTLTATKTVKCVPLPPPPPAVSYHVDCVSGKDDNNGLTADSAFATIQNGIDAAKDGDTVLVHPGVYTEEVRFKGKAITLRSAGDAAILQNPGDFAVAFYYGEGPDSILKNFIIRDSLTGVFAVASSPTISNVTVVGNDYGIEAYVGAEPDISSSIVWGNGIADLVGCTARFSCLQQRDPGPTNISRDPLFADPNQGDYHLRSTRGRYWPEHDIWVLDDVTSPCIDAGDPNSPLGQEPAPNGGRIDMGAHGGTTKASLSPGSRR